MISPDHAPFGGEPARAAALREEMVTRQIERRGIRDARVLDAMRRVPRHAFVPNAALDDAYGDHPAPIGYGQTISQPYMVALMVEQLRLTPETRVLEIGTGSGYQTAILARLAAEVWSIEIVPELVDDARPRLAEVGASNVHIVIADGSLGYPPAAPYDGIVVSAGAPRVPEPLEAQLAEGGRLVIPVGSRGSQSLLVLEREGDNTRRFDVCGCVFVPLLGDHGWPP